MNEHSITTRPEKQRLRRGSLQARVGTITATNQGTAWREGASRFSLSLLFNSTALILGKIATMGLGFLAWLLAARLFAPTDVGLASGAISAMMFCTQLALLGLGSAVMALFPQHQVRPAQLLNSALNIAMGAAVLVAGSFLAVSSNIFRELSIIGSMPLYALLFLAMSVFGTVTIFSIKHLLHYDAVTRCWFAASWLD